MLEFIKQLLKKELKDAEDTIMDAPQELSVEEVQTPEEPISFFTSKELKCKCGCNTDTMDKMDPEFLRMLNKARSIAGKPWKVNSAYRCPEHNQKVGGKKNSAHVLGCAADISAPTSAKKFEIVNAAIQAGFTRIGIGSNFVHLDSAHTASHPEHVMWTY